MPELPEVETIVRALRGELANRTIADIELSRSDIIHGDPRPLAALLPGRRVRAVRRRAKRVVIELQPSAQLIFHLGMSGRLTVCPRSSPVESHTHLRVWFTKCDRELRFRDPRRFGGVWCFSGGDEHVGRRLGELGPEPLELNLRGFRRIASRGRQIKALLLDQRVIAGLGNIYCDESLHGAGIHPAWRADSLDFDQVRRLLRSIKSTLRRAIRSKGSTLTDYRQANGREGSFQKYHRVYRREGLPCRKCGTTIGRFTVAGRSTFLCPKCQPARQTQKPNRDRLPFTSRSDIKGKRAAKSRNVEKWKSQKAKD